ncbi:hypothetical protein [Mycolicibacterium farcinogenes]|uniref:Uncharacterized protein n=1 Tax=Mycolicibacterium farcinogenes TaxID=1802 RepID=A0ACD1FH94_MYCFR|nr:hypothetical protein [Mycolicibacterium farcinogenes]QZH66432.1 hypothetical protein K6L26_01570 [Mycolicibacterium farcinogenes]
MLLAGCSFTPASIRPAPPAASTPAAAAATPAPADPPPVAGQPNTANLTASFTALAEHIPGEVGITITDGQHTLQFGTWDTGPAWSTIKVPLAIAAARHDPANTAPLIERAITASDNAAADELWASLGDPAAAATAVHQVLADGTNPDVYVQAEQIRPPYSPYGQTIWPQIDAARFAWTLPCIPDAGPVLTQMRNITPDQQWGLAALDNTASKGGWGPGPDGNYLARQIGLYQTETGPLGVAIATTPDDGTFATATSILNNLANWITQNTAELPGAGSCTNS